MTSYGMNVNNEVTFIKKLIENVKARPILYDKRCEGYYNKPLKMELWSEVSQISGQSIPVCRSRWKSLRERFNRALKRMQEAECTGEKYKEVWCFFDDLRFLRDCIVPRTYVKPDNTLENINGNFLKSSDHEDLTVLSFEDIDVPFAPMMAESQQESPPPFSPTIKRSSKHSLSETTMLSQPASKKPRLCEAYGNLNNIMNKMQTVINDLSTRKERSYITSSMEALQGLITDLPKDLQDVCIMDMFKIVMNLRAQARSRGENVS